jgi:type II secretory pathway predicted ATPase ExeA
VIVRGSKEGTASMRAEVMEFYGLTRSPRAVGYYETTHHRQLLQDIKQAVYDGNLVALCGVVGAGKTVRCAGCRRCWRARTASSCRNRSLSRRAA